MSIDISNGAKLLINIAGMPITVWNILKIDVIPTYKNEEVIMKRMLKISPGDHFIDAGAACGSYTLVALAMGAAKVDAFSPEDTSSCPYRSVMQKNLEINGWETRCKIWKYGLYSKPGFIIPNGIKIGDFIPEDPDNNDLHTDKQFPVITLDSISFQRLNFIKFDVEACEAFALKGAKITIEKHRPTILIENHIQMDSNIEEKCKSILGSYGYETIDRVQDIFVSHTLYEHKDEI